MVQLNLVSSSNTSLVKSKPLVAVFIGATSGIGKNTFKALATTHGEEGKGLRAYIIGRNAKAAEAIISECQKVCPHGDFRFLRANDLALIKDVDIVCADVIKSEEIEAKATGGNPKIDILIQSQANFKPFDPRNGKSNETLSLSALNPLCAIILTLKFQRPQKVWTALCPSFTTPACDSS